MFSIVAAMIWLMAGNVSALYDDAALGALDVPLKFSLASFVVFSFLSFEMSHKLRRYKLDECMDTVTHAKRKIFLAQGIVFAVVIFAFFIVFNIWWLISFIKYRNFNCWHGKFIIQTVLNMLLSHFFSSMLRCGYGYVGIAAFSQNKRLSRTCALHAARFAAFELSRRDVLFFQP